MLWLNYYGPSKLATFGDKRFATKMDGISVLSPRYLLGEN